MKIKVICVGKIKEKFYRDAISEYQKRLGRYCELSIIEVEDEPTKEHASETMIEEVKQKEGARILKRIAPSDYVIGLCIDGKQKDSVSLSRHLDDLWMTNSSIAFVIGGSLGLSQEVISMCREKLSFSKLTFPHQLMRVILLEQIYRSYRISRNEPYHK